jgi:hypothetical protein
MKFDTIAEQRAQRHAYDQLAEKYIDKAQTVPNPFYTDPNNITERAVLIQEQPYVNTQNQFAFDFSNQGPVGTAFTNVRKLSQNSRFSVYALQLLIGTGANANNRTYLSRGATVNDNAIYNSTISIQFETGVLVNGLEGQNYLEVAQSNTENWAEMGMQLINPLRMLTGRIGTWLVTITLNNSIAALALTPNTFLSMRLWGCLGQAK